MGSECMRMRDCVCCSCGAMLLNDADRIMCPNCGEAGEPTHEVPPYGTTKCGGEPSQKGE